MEKAESLYLFFRMYNVNYAIGHRIPSFFSKDKDEEKLTLNHSFMFSPHKTSSEIQIIRVGKDLREESLRTSSMCFYTAVQCVHNGSFLDFHYMECDTYHARQWSAAAPKLCVLKSPNLLSHRLLVIFWTTIRSPALIIL